MTSPRRNRGMSVGLEAHLALKASFVQKVSMYADEQKEREQQDRQQAAEFITSDPLNLAGEVAYPDLSDESPKKEKDSRKAVQVRGRRNHLKDDIFTAFGKEHGNSADMEEYEINGMVQTRVNYKKNWQSDSDLFRWRKALNDNSRNSKLLSEVQARWHPNYHTDRAELVAKHNALFRQRNFVQPNDEPHKKFSSTGAKHLNSSAKQLKELQKLLVPKQKSQKKRDALQARNSEMDFMLGALFGKEGKNGKESTEAKALAEWRPRSRTEDEVLRFITCVNKHFKNLEEAFASLDDNHNGRISYSEFEKWTRSLEYKGNHNVIFKKLDLNGDGVIGLAEFMNLKPYMIQDLLRRQPGEAMASGVEGFKGKITALCAPGGRINHANTSPSATLHGSPGNPSAPESPERSVTSHQEFDGTMSLKRAATAPGNVGLSLDGTTRSLPPLSDTDFGEDSPMRGEDFSDCSREKRRRSYSSFGDEAGLWQDEATDLGRARSSQVKYPRTMSLLIFRNAHRAHAGEVVFIQKPPLSLDHLLRLCSQVCWPVVPPVEQLLDTSLKPVKSLQQVHSGATYLLKGKEGLDPPPQFFAHQPASESSLRHLNEVQVASLAERNKNMGQAPSDRPFSSASQATSNMQLAPLSRRNSGATFESRPTTSADMSRPTSSATFVSRPTTSAAVSRPESGYLVPDFSDMFEGRPTTASAVSQPESGIIMEDSDVFQGRPTTSAAVSRPESGSILPPFSAAFAGRPTTSAAVSRPESGIMITRQNSSEAGALWPPLSAGGSMYGGSLSSSRVGSPPQQTRGVRSGTRPETADKWEVNQSLKMKLSYGGLGMCSKHHNFDQWSQVRKGRTPEEMEKGTVPQDGERGLPGLYPSDVKV